MSDAMTDILRDRQQGELSQRLVSLELDLLDGAVTASDIKTLIKLWTEYAYLPRGYWMTPNRGLALERIQMYKRLLEEGELVIKLSR